MLTREELAAEVEAGTIDTVVCAFTDMQGRLMGKREEAHFFVSETLEHGLEGCNYLLALDMEMDPQPGYDMASWDRGYGDFHLKPDLDTLRRVPWLRERRSSSATSPGRTARRSSPRRARCSRRRSTRARAAGFEPMVGSELEFYLLKESYAQAHAQHYRDLTPSVPYILDYSILATTYDEGLSARSATGCRRRASPSRARRARRGRGSRRSTSATPTRCGWPTTM